MVFLDLSIVIFLGFLEDNSRYLFMCWICFSVFISVYL